MSSSFLASKENPLAAGLLSSFLAPNKPPVAGLSSSFLAPKENPLAAGLASSFLAPNEKPEEAGAVAVDDVDAPKAGVEVPEVVPKLTVGLASSFFAPNNPPVGAGEASLLAPNKPPDAAGAGAEEVVAAGAPNEKAEVEVFVVAGLAPNNPPAAGAFAVVESSFFAAAPNPPNDGCEVVVLEPNNPPVAGADVVVEEVPNAAGLFSVVDGFPNGELVFAGAVAVEPNAEVALVFEELFPKTFVDVLPKALVGLVDVELPKAGVRVPVLLAPKPLVVLLLAPKAPPVLLLAPKAPPVLVLLPKALPVLVLLPKAPVLLPKAPVPAGLAAPNVNPLDC